MKYHYTKKRKEIAQSKSLRELYRDLEIFNSWLHSPRGNPRLKRNQNFTISCMLEELGRRSYLQDKRGSKEKEHNARW